MNTRTICLSLLTFSLICFIVLPVRVFGVDFEIVCPQTCDGVPLKMNLTTGKLSSLGEVEEAIANLSCENAKKLSSEILVINEVDYDQPSTDTAEFIELKNDSGFPINLDLFTIDLVSGASGTPIYRTIDLPDICLDSGGYYVICGDAANVENCDLDVSPDSNLIQNGSPDAVALKKNGFFVDLVSYEGDTVGYTEGSGAGLVDDPTGDESISRCPDGTDTNQNNVDFSSQLPTPGEENSCL